ncbi:hypothetical protein [Corynebacterium freiburgense]|uniref:hypothetical protein n=1 Tax=Corynebacterium freiburgense TaxID=556548 RepID=UPI00041C5090|nr:hypothetical protein [Corynebacterium freiburgense]WJZ02193.1 hypothetical protein CFREI_04485 [Corynebacterium freiburgense]
MSMRRLAQLAALAFLGIVFISTWLLVLGVPIYWVLFIQLNAALVVGGIVWWYTERTPEQCENNDDIAPKEADSTPIPEPRHVSVEEAPTVPMPTPKALPQKVPTALQTLDIGQAKDQLRSALGTQIGDAPTAAKMSQAKMLPGARAAMERFGLSEEQLRSAIAGCRPRPAEQGRYQFVVADHSVIVSEDGTCILGVFPYGGPESDLVEAARDKAKAAVRKPSPMDMPRKRVAPKVDRRIAAPTTAKEMKELLEQRGFEVELRGKHYNVTHPDHPGVRSTMAASPSDFRWNLNLISQIRGAFGVDLRLA